MLVGIAPQAVADLGVEHFGEAFRETVGERLQQDVVIIVDGLLEALEMRFEAVDSDREAADPVLALRIDEIGEAHVRATFALLHLLAKHRQRGSSRCRRARARRRLRACSATGRRSPSA